MEEERVTIKDQTLGNKQSMAGDMNWRHASALGIHLSLLVVVAWGR